jgi:hypothetical protein
MGRLCRELGVNYIQLSLPCIPSEADIPPEAMLDPVANTLDLRQPFSMKTRAKRVRACLDSQSTSAFPMSVISTTCSTTIRPCGKSQARFHETRDGRGGALGAEPSAVSSGAISR